MTSTAIKLAREFHDLYESLAPSFGYETRQDTKVFDPNSQNGRLMVAVCEKICRRAQAQALLDAAKKFRGEIGYNFVAADGYSNAFDVASELEYMAEELERGA